MNYENIITGKFISRENRFIANVLVEGEEERVHVPNTGRCRELLIPGVEVVLNKSSNPNRKTKYSLVSVYKGENLINIDSQMPNKVVIEAIKSKKLFPNLDILELKPEYTYKNSRIDVFFNTPNEKYLLEVKGVTLEENSIALFPDAPTLRGVKHIEELINSTEDGYTPIILFLLQMKGISEFYPNFKMQPDFGKSLLRAKRSGVEILIYDSIVKEDEILLDSKIPLGNPLKFSTLGDIPKIVDIFNESSLGMKEDGINQWQGSTTPNEKSIFKDMENSSSYVFKVGDEIMGTVAICTGDDPTYMAIYKGEWQFTGDYITVHRFALHKNYKGMGLSREFFHLIFNRGRELGVKNIRIDTHRDNFRMRGLIESLGFRYAGIIIVADGTERVAYERRL